ncbi:TPA: hypothetical protein RQK49_004202 [Vibrio vulnificus]|nr:hypothetical protein [Vibrio vulnificus]
MNRSFLNIITQLLRELNLNAAMFSLANDSTTILKSKNVILVRRGSIGDYFLLTEIQTSELDSVNRDLQTSLMLQLKSLLSDTGAHDLQPLSGVPTLEIDNHFEKNTTLLLFMQKTSGFDKLLSKITEVEEDEYYFKKQVVLLPTEFLNSLGNKISSSTDFEITRYLQSCMNNVEKFKKFMSKTNEDTDYAGCAQLFEKLPFLHLNVESSESNSLQNMIEKEITENTEKYSITISLEKEDEDSKLVILDKNLNDINTLSLKYALKSEESDAKLDAKELLNNILGNGLHE